jgi:hypothetical protein
VGVFEPPLIGLEESGLGGTIATTGSLPEPLCDLDRIDPILSPPLSFVSAPMQRPMM